MPGAQLSPFWPQLSLKEGQRAGDQNETYHIVFSTSDGEKTFQTTNADLYNAAQQGTEWTLKVNTFGAIVDIEPTN